MPDTEVAIAMESRDNLIAALTARVNRLNVLLVRYEREADEAEATSIRLQAELAELRAQAALREHDLPY